MDNLNLYSEVCLCVGALIQSQPSQSSYVAALSHQSLLEGGVCGWVYLIYSLKTN